MACQTARGEALDKVGYLKPWFRPKQARPEVIVGEFGVYSQPPYETTPRFLEDLLTPTGLWLLPRRPDQRGVTRSGHQDCANANGTLVALGAVEDLRVGLRAAADVWAQAFRSGRSIRFEPFTTKILSHLHAAMPCASRCQLGAREIVEAAFIEAADDVAEALYREGCEAFLQYFYRQTWTANPASELVQVRRKGMNLG